METFNSTISIVLLTAFLLFCSPTNAQAPDTLWTRTFGAEHESADAMGIALMQDGCFLVAGNIKLPGATVYRIWLFKIDPDGNLIWERDLYFEGSNVGANSIKSTPDGGFVVAGYGKAGYEKAYGLIIKLDSLGDEEWRHLYGNTTETTMFNDAVGTDDNRIIAVGLESIVGLSPYVCYLVITDSDGGLIGSYKDFCNDYSIAYAVSRTSDGGFVFTGFFRSDDYNNESIFIHKFNNLGDSLQYKRTVMQGDQYGNSVQQTADGGYIVAGKQYQTSPNDGDLLLVRYDSNMEELWITNIGEGQYTLNAATHVEVLPDDNYIVCGQTASYGSFDMWALRFDNLGDTLWTKYVGKPDYREGARQLLPLPEGGYILAGNRSSASYKTEALIVRLAPEQSSGTEVNESIFAEKFSLFQNFPNPFNSETTIKYQLIEPGWLTIKIFNIMGQEIHTLVNEEKQPGSYSITWDANGVPQGVYLCQMICNGRQLTRRMVVWSK